MGAPDGTANLNQLRRFNSNLKMRIPQKTIKLLLIVFIIIASMGFVSYAIYANWNELTSQQWDIDYRYLILSVLFYPLAYFPTVFAWHTLLGAMHVKCGFRTNLRIYSLSHLPKHVPGLVWFVTSRSLLYEQENVPARLVVTASGAEMGLMALTGFLSSSILLFYSAAIRNLASVHVTAIILVVILVAFIVILLNPYKFLNKFLKNQDGETSIRFDTRHLLATLFWLFIVWIGSGLIMFVLIRAITQITWSYLPLLIGVVGMSGAVSLTIGVLVQGWFIREVTISALLSTMLPPLMAIAIAVAFRLVLLIGEVLWMSIFIWITRTPRKV